VDDEDVAGLDAILRGPQFHLRVWDFLAAVREGSVGPSTAAVDFLIAQRLGGMFQGFYTSVLEQAGMEPAEAAAAYADFVAGQQTLYGSLAAGGDAQLASPLPEFPWDDNGTPDAG
jgi:hypothetical protein